MAAYLVWEIGCNEKHSKKYQSWWSQHENSLQSC